ncbi:MFS transporter [Microtetraspora sp. NBRC 13810]|uniref:MFS transporter n=1 Tax=Microtetraspora sp. NBRC 13810 TaxID=3030990 RepID=UPI0024A12E94|nr:MFS transporter [Microtetraspora sp. NBRC 13810]GLW10610.1 MFS transporter [Microtetraspora sp. NBRC 13810]
MGMEPYRQVLALPGVRALLLVGVFARIPVTAMGLTLTLHVSQGMGLGLTQASLVGAVVTLGTAAGAPLVGRFIDGRGLRAVLVVTTVAQLVFWVSAPFLPYFVLLGAAAFAGLLTLPVFTVIRQGIAAMVPAERRRPGFALDSMSVEVSYMIGPAVAAVAVTSLGSFWTMVSVGVGAVLSGVALFALNPPISSAGKGEPSGAAVPRRQWLTPGFVALLCVVAALTFTLTATELAVVATMLDGGVTEWSGLVIGLWCAYSLAGGFVYGTLSRGFSPLALSGAMCALTVPIGLAGGGWGWLCLALLPAGLLCAPALSATVDQVSRSVPAVARGEAMGFHSTALTLGVASGGPFAGWLLDSHGPAWGFAVTGLVGGAVVLAAWPFWRRARPVAEPVVTSGVESVQV